jgi:outer membrane autotransporter protein
MDASRHDISARHHYQQQARIACVGPVTGAITMPTISRPSRITILYAGVCAAALVLAASPALAGTYTAFDDASLRNAITAANADADSSATITLANNVTMTTTPLPGATKPITIDTGSFTYTSTYNNASNLFGAVNMNGTTSGSNYIFKGNFQAATSGVGGNTAGDNGMFMNAGKVIEIDGTVTGGAGGGVGGSGGAGAIITGQSTVTNKGTIAGGSAVHGNGGNAVVASSGATLVNTGAIRGGDGMIGGSGVSMSSVPNRTILNSGTIQGGKGTTGAGGTGVRLIQGNGIDNSGTIAGGDGVAGAAGVDITGLNAATAIFTNSGTIRGGAGSGGTSGNGVTVRANVGPMTNTGTIIGGAGAYAVANAAGAISLVNSGTIQAGTGQATAINMTGAFNLTLELHQGSAITGNVVGSTAAAANTLILSGDDNASFDVSTVGPQYQNFTAFQKAGNSVWTLTGTGTVATPWTISAGTLQLSDGASIIGDVADNATLAFGSSTPVTFASNITGSGAVVQAGSGITTLSGTNTYSGGTNFNAGTLSVSDDTNLGDAAGTLNFNGGILQITGGMAGTARTITWGVNGGGFDIADGGNVFTVGQALTGGQLTKLGAGTLVLTADNSYSGGTTIAAGTLQLGDGGTTGGITGDVTNNGTLVFNRADTMTLGGAITGSGGVKQTGAGTTILTGQSSYSGETDITGGTLQVSGGGTAGGAGFVDMETTLVVTGAGSSFTAGDLVAGRGAGPATITVDNGGHLTTGRSFLGEAFQSTSTAITIAVDGAGSVWNAGDFLQLAGVTGGTAALTVSNGGVIMTNPGGGAEIGRGGDGIVLVTGAGSQLLAGGLTVGEPFNGVGTGHGQLTVADGGVVRIEAGGLSQIGVGGQGVVLVTGAGSQLLAGDYLSIGASGGATGDGQLTIQDGGLVSASTVALSYNDGISIGNSGTLLVQGTAGARGVLETATLSKGYDTASATFDGGILRASGSSTDFISSYAGDYVTIGVGGMFLDTNGFDVTASSALSGAGALTKQGAGTLILSANNSYAGGTTIETGVLQLGDGGTAGSILGNIADNGTLAFNRADAVSIAGLVSGSGAVRQAGAGTTILLAANSYSGGTAISAGALQLGNGGTTGSITGDVTDNGTLIFNRSDALGFAGVISGNGGIVQAGAGNTTLSGANSYGGGTVIAAGMLTGSATSFGSGAITDNATLVIDQATDSAFANAINGSGSFTKQGAGRLNYTGSGSLSGATTVTAGLLSVNGSLAVSAVTVQGGAMLGGNGTVGATTIQSGATIAPGNSIGTLHVSGAYRQAAGSVYQVQLDPNSGASDLITASGAAVLDSGAGLSVVKDQPGAYRLGATYTVLHADGGVSGTYALSGDTLAASPYLGLRDSYDANNVYLLVVQTADPAGAAQTGNQQQTAGGTGSLPGNSDVGSAVLNTPDPGATRAAFDQLSGEAVASAGSMLVSGSVLVRDTTFDRLRDMLCDAAATDQRRSGCDAQRATVWAQGFGDWGQAYGSADAARVSQTTGGFLMGVDVPVAGWRLGFFGGHSRSDFDVVARNSAGISDSEHLGAYGGTNWGDLGLRLGASYSWNHLTTARHIAFGDFANDLGAHYNAGTAQVFGEAGQTFALDSFTVEPFANLAYVNLRTDGFSETGGAAALTSRTNTMEDTFATLGVRPATVIALGSVELVARGMLGWRHTFGGVTPQSVVSFAGGDAFTVTGAPIARDAGVVEAGVHADLSGGASIGLTYGGQFSDRASDNSIRGTLAVAF